MNIEQIVDDFSVLDSWDDRYRYVIELGKALPPLPEGARIDRNKVQGCASQVWLVSETKPGKNGSGPMLSFQGDSDAHIVKGLIAILFSLYSEQPARAILRTGRDRAVREARAQGTSHAAALERIPLHGRAHPRRCEGGAGGGGVAPTTCSASDLIMSASDPNLTRTSYVRMC